jgi:hypothetical protein
MTKIAISAILKRCSEEKKKEDRVGALRANCDQNIKTILQLMFHPDAKFLLPEGTPPYRPSQFNETNMLYTELRKMHYFLEGSTPPEMKQIKRERMFIDILEAIDPADAELLVAVKDKKSPYKGLTQDVVLAAFPELFPA